jgi:hypothetical protein
LIKIPSLPAHSVFPLSDKSGVNLTSAVNVANVTEYDDGEEEEAEQQHEPMSGRKGAGHNARCCLPPHPSLAHS